MEIPQQLSSLAIREFQQIYAKEFGRPLPDEEAAKMATDFLRLFDLLVQQRVQS